MTIKESRSRSRNRDRPTESHRQRRRPRLLQLRLQLLGQSAKVPHDRDSHAATDIWLLTVI